MVFYIRRGGIRWTLRIRVLHAPAPVVAGRAAAPDPLVGVRACTLGGPGDAWRSRTPRGGAPGLHPCVLSAPLGRTRDVAKPLPQWEAGLDGRCRQHSNGSSAEPVLSRIAGSKALLQ